MGFLPHIEMLYEMTARAKLAIVKTMLEHETPAKTILAVLETLDQMERKSESETQEATRAGKIPFEPRKSEPTIGFAATAAPDPNAPLPLEV